MMWRFSKNIFKLDFYRNFLTEKFSRIDPLNHLLIFKFSGSFGQFGQTSQAGGGGGLFGGSGGSGGSGGFLGGLGGSAKSENPNKNPFGASTGTSSVFGNSSSQGSGIFGGASSTPFGGSAPQSSQSSFSGSGSGM